jgi:hypothetical protein
LQRRSLCEAVYTPVRCDRLCASAKDEGVANADI